MGKNWQGRVTTIIQEKGSERPVLLPCLEAIQESCGYIPPEAVIYLRDTFDLPSADIYGVLSFYHNLSTREKGKNVIKVCDSLPCHLGKSDGILNIIEKELGIKAGDTTPDKLFTIETVPCLGMCDQAPAMMVNEKSYGNLTTNVVKRIIDLLREHDK
jgi:NADH-quinone oxidoreductase subunit E